MFAGAIEDFRFRREAVLDLVGGLWRALLVGLEVMMRSSLSLSDPTASYCQFGFVRLALGLVGVPFLPVKKPLLVKVLAKAEDGFFFEHSIGASPPSLWLDSASCGVALGVGKC